MGYHMGKFPRFLELKRFQIGYLAATGRGTSHTDATRARDLAPTAFRRRNSSGVSRRQTAVGYSSRSTGMGRLYFSSPCMAQRVKGGKGGAAGSETQGGVR
jgi:hypothetical protein